MAILVTGGAGYIGSVAVDDLRSGGEKVVVIDNLVYGHRKAVDPRIAFYQGDIGDKQLVRRILAENEIEACMHFSAYAYVGESVENPGKYFENNISQTLSLLDVLLEHNVKKIVFSSTCSTYGEPRYSPIDEDHPQAPTNPYGWSKLMVERALDAFDHAHGLKFISLRYFNAAGATERHGEHHEPETHLIPLALAAAQGRRSFLSVFGEDYPTPDGTAIRDFIHVSDLSRAHVLALQHLQSGRASDFINLGNGKGHSVKEVINAARQVTGKSIETRSSPRRPGDPPQLVSDSRKAESVLGWKPQVTELERIIESAWKWHLAYPDGYA